MTDRKPTHGPWHGLDFDAELDLNSVAALCPKGWLLLFWDGGAMLPLNLYGAPADEGAAIVKSLNDNPIGPCDFGLEEWPEGRLFVGRLVWEDPIYEQGRMADPGGYGVELLGMGGSLYEAPAFADALPKSKSEAGGGD